MTLEPNRPHDAPLDPDRIALGIQQPWAELILRGDKTLEVRSLNTQIRGRIYLYTSKRLSTLPAAHAAAERHGLRLEELPCGLLVGSVELTASRPTTSADVSASCVPAELLLGQWAWQFSSPERFPQPVPVRLLPYGVWFYPFRRRSKSR